MRKGTRKRLLVQKGTGEGNRGTLLRKVMQQGRAAC